MKNNQNKEQIYYFFNEGKNPPNVQIGKAFEIYLKDIYKSKGFEKNEEKR